MAVSITLGAVTTGKTVKDVPFSTIKGSVINKKDGTKRNVTAMAFGAQRDSVLKLPRKGRTITVEGVFEGGVFKILGPDKAKIKAKADQADQPAEQVAEAA